MTWWGHLPGETGRRGTERGVGGSVSRKWRNGAGQGCEVKFFFKVTEIIAEGWKECRRGRGEHVLEQV